MVYALPREQSVVRIQVEPGTTLRQAIEQSGLLRRHPEIDLARSRLGSFGKPRDADEPVSAGDRVEIYRALAADPKERRRARAKASSRRE